MASLRLGDSFEVTSTCWSEDPLLQLFPESAQSSAVADASCAPRFQPSSEQVRRHARRHGVVVALLMPTAAPPSS